LPRTPRSKGPSQAPRRQQQPAAPDPVRAGHDALAQGDWDAAQQQFERAVAENDDSAEAWEGLGMAVWWHEDYASAIRAREQAYRIYRSRDDRRGAARMGFYLAMDHADAQGQIAVAEGWIARSRRLLEGLPPTPELAMLLLLDGHQALMGDNDTGRARELAAQAIEIARAVGPPDAEVLGLAMEGLARVSEGEVAGGMRLLDEATTAALAGELTDLNAIGTTCCYLIHACERVRDFDRATQWCDKVKEFCTRWNFTGMFTVCRTQYAYLLIARGAWAEAEAELAAATSELLAHRPSSVASSMIRLAELRRRQGRLDEAEALFQQAPQHRLSLLGRAEIALDRGHPEQAQDLVAQYLRRFPAETRTERVVGLELAVRVGVQMGMHAESEGALRELQEIAIQLGTDPLRATVLYAEGILAREREDQERARVCFEDAADLFDAGEIPFEAGLARIGLAEILIEMGRPEVARAQIVRARATFAALGAVAEEAKGAAVEARIGAGSTAPPPAASKVNSLTGREIEILRLVAAGMNDRQIAERLFLSQHTVHRHVSNILTKSNLPSRSAAVAYASKQGLL
jgi:DNA-binding CsgD family transcriptional regulator